MISQQLRTWDVSDQRVLDVMSSLPRERFVPPAFQSLAYADISIPVEAGGHMLQPKIQARMLQAVAPRPADAVLEIGTGSGYLTACLARLAASVVSLDIDPACTAVYDRRFEQSLAPGGRLFVVVGSPPAREARLITRGSGDGWARETLFETDIPPLENAPEADAFVF